MLILCCVTRWIKYQLVIGYDLIYSNIEVKKAQELGIQTLSFARALALFFNSKKICISVIGVGGKTTVSAWLATCLEFLDKNPSYMTGVGEVKSLDFPGVGKVVSRKIKGKWIIKDEEDLVKKLTNSLSDEELKPLFKTTKKLVKKEADKLFDRWNVSGSMDDAYSNCVKKEDDKINLLISIYDDLPEAIDAVDDSKDTKLEDLDKLEF